MRRFYLLSFIAGVICSVFWAVIIVWSIFTGRFRAHPLKELSSATPLLFFLWATREMLRGLRETRTKEKE